jgi:hypothetical protein
VTAAKSMGGGGSVTSLPSISVAGVALGTDGAPDVEQYEVTLVMVEVAILQPCQLLRRSGTARKAERKTTVDVPESYAC